MNCKAYREEQERKAAQYREPIIRAVRAGETITVPARGGGFVRGPAQSDGIVIETIDNVLFMPVASIRKALRTLQSK